MRKLKECFRDESGVSFPLVIAVTLSLLLILCGVMEYLRLNLMAAGVKEAVYHGVREGYSGGYTSDGSGFEATVDDGDIYYELDRVLGTHSEGGAHVKYAEGVLEYKITDLQVTIRNAPLAPSDPRNAQRFEADAMVTLEVPVRFAGKVFPSLRMRLKVQAGYIEVF